MARISNRSIQLASDIFKFYRFPDQALRKFLFIHEFDESLLDYSNGNTLDVELTIKNMAGGKTIFCKLVENLRKELYELGDLVKYYPFIGTGNIPARTSLIHKFDRLIQQLKIDGFIFENKKLIEADTEIIDVQKEKNLLEEMMARNSELSQEILKKHLKDSDELFIQGKWHPSINEARSFLEQLREDIYLVVKSKYPKQSTLPTQEWVNDKGKTFKFDSDYRKNLCYLGFLDDEELKFLEGNYQLLSKFGSHKGIPVDHEARISRMVFLAEAQYLLTKFEEWKRNNS